MTIKIDKDIPTPPKPRVGAQSVYPFNEMAPGDSFYVPKPEGRTITAHVSNLSALATQWARHNGGKFCVRRSDDQKGARVWMLETPAPLLPIKIADLAPAKVHVIADEHDEEEPSKRRAAKSFAHEIPSFADGAKARVVRGKRY